MSNAVIPPRIAPSSALLAPCIEESHPFKASIIIAIGVPITHITTAQTINVPTNGNMNIVLIDFKESGN